MNHSDLMAVPTKADYNYVTRTGRITLAGLGCTDMTGAIRFFRRIDPGVQVINTFNDDGPDTVYSRTENGDWVAVSAGRSGRIGAAYVEANC